MISNINTVLEATSQIFAESAMKTTRLLAIIIGHMTIAESFIVNNAAFAFSSDLYVGKLSFRLPILMILTKQGRFQKERIFHYPKHHICLYFKGAFPLQIEMD